METTDENVCIYTPETVYPLMLQGLREGKVKGTTTYNKEIDLCWTWRKKEANIWTGMANEGKTAFLKQLCLIKSLKEGWRFIVCCPEDFPAEEYFDDMIHTLIGKTTDRDLGTERVCTEEQYEKAYKLIKDNFIFLYIKSPNNTIPKVLEEFEKICNEMQIDGVIMDPLMKFSRPKEMSDMRDDLYASYISSLCMDFCRRTNTSLHLVIHQVTPQLDVNTKKYPEPSMYRIKSGGSWADGFDNVLSVWRPNYATDKFDTEVQFSSQKIKKQKLVGIPQRVTIGFERKSNRYTLDKSSTPLFPFDEFMKENKRDKAFEEYCKENFEK